MDSSPPFAGHRLCMIRQRSGTGNSSVGKASGGGALTAPGLYWVTGSGSSFWTPGRRRPSSNASSASRTLRSVSSWSGDSGWSEMEELEASSAIAPSATVWTSFSVSSSSGSGPPMPICGPKSADSKRIPANFVLLRSNLSPASRAVSDVSIATAGSRCASICSA